MHSRPPLPPAGATPGNGWTPDAAARMALELGIGRLAERHWCAIASCREEAARTGHAPGLRALTTLTGLTARELGRLFPGSPATTIARLAGVPAPNAGAARTRTSASRRRHS